VVCPVCQQESGSAGVCAKCGATLVPGQASSTGDPFGSTKPTSASDNIKPALAGVAVVMAWTGVVLLSVLRARRWSGGEMTAEAMGYAVGSLLTPILISAFIVWAMNRLREVKMTASRKHALMASFALGVTLVSFAGEAARPRNTDTTQKQIGHLLKQAAGKEAISENSEWYSGPARDFFRDILSYNQEYTAAINSATSSLPKLYTPESYATKTGVQATVTQLQTLLDVDKKYESLEPIFKRLETNIVAAAPTKSASDEFLQGFHNTQNKALGPRNETFRAEEEWLQSSIDLYQFAVAHFSDYKVRSKKLIFTHDDVREQFQTLQSKSLALHKTAMEAKKVLDASRQKSLAQTGVTPEDLSPTPSKQQ
jgi:hypothetical protein